MFHGFHEKNTKIGKSKESKRKPKEINENHWEMKGNQWEINEQQQFSMVFRIFLFFYGIVEKTIISRKKSENNGLF